MIDKNRLPKALPVSQIVAQKTKTPPQENKNLSPRVVQWDTKEIVPNVKRLFAVVRKVFFLFANH